MLKLNQNFPNNGDLVTLMYICEAKGDNVRKVIRSLSQRTASERPRKGAVSSAVIRGARCKADSKYFHNITSLRHQYIYGCTRHVAEKSEGCEIGMINN